MASLRLRRPALTAPPPSSPFPPIEPRMNWGDDAATDLRYVIRAYRAHMVSRGMHDDLMRTCTMVTQGLEDDQRRCQIGRPLWFPFWGSAASSLRDEIIWTCKPWDRPWIWVAKERPKVFLRYGEQYGETAPGEYLDAYLCHIAKLLEEKR